ncbi:hypothetical protein LG943_05710 [Streptomonospora sp. S1-112]|uniref:NB-ARC domain-containing protein n=1 Tax=Streptomonospora mangrovi TaxID=2883123 RepID=A0A9X3NTC4_9ACTN|nr:NB-ARC domain-containing protein [Streptomonospora mangrovi]MDA0563826.1 hypothetical protein [Streptomonospora mangrovi]
MPERRRRNPGRRRGVIFAAISVVTAAVGAVTNIVTGQSAVAWWLVGLLAVLIATVAVLSYLSERGPAPDTSDASDAPGSQGVPDTPGSSGGAGPRRGRGVVHEHRHSFPLPRPAPGPVNALPPKLPGFTGRQRELAHLRDHIEADGGGAKIYAIDGMGGVGKTALAVRLAHEVAARFPDGVLFLDMRAHTSGQDPYRPAEAIEALLLQLSDDNAALPARLEALQARWRAELNSRRLLVVVDNVADADQVRPLLAGDGRSALILTSRARLALPGVRAVSLTPPPAGEAQRMFADALGDHPAAASTEDIAEVVRALGGLPLAVVLAATWLAHRPAATVADLLARLPASQQPVEDMLELSYGELPEDLRTFGRLIAHHPAAVITPVAASALADLPLARARERLDGLYDRHLIEAAEERAGQYRLHDLVRSFLLERSARAETPAQAEAAFARLAGAYCGLAAKVERDAYAALDQDREGLLLAAERAVERRIMPWAWRLPVQITPYLRMRGLARTGVHLCTRALAGMRPVRDLRARAHLSRALGQLALVVGTPPEAREWLRTARRLALLGLDLRSYAMATHPAMRSGPAEEADGPFTRWVVDRVYTWQLRGASPKTTGHLLVGWAGELRHARETDRARATLERAVEVLTEAGDLHCASGALTALAHIQWHEGAYDDARATVERARAYSVHMSCSYCTARDDVLLASYQRNGGDDAAAERHLRGAVAVFTDMGAAQDRLSALLDLAQLHHRRGERAAAAAALDEAQAGLRTDDWSGHALVRRRRAVHAAEAGDAAAGHRHLAAAFDLLEIIDGPDAADDRAHSHLDMAALLRMSGDLEGARTRARRALEMLEALEKPTCQAYAHKELAQIAEAADDPATAETHRRRERELREAVFHG